MLKKFFIIIIILIVMITILSAVLLLTKPKPPVAPIEKEPAVQPQQPADQTAEPKMPVKTALPPAELDNSFLEFDGKKIAPASAEARQQSELQELARFYLTNFGAYSANNFEHIANLKNLSSPKVESYLDNFISQEREKLRNHPFYSIKTEAVNVSFESLDLDGGFAKANVSTLRIENEPPQFANRSFEQKADIWFSKVDGNWQAVRVEWRE